jgi:hypothetical protein
VLRITDNICYFTVIANFTDKDVDREVPETEARSWADENGFGYQEVSAKEGAGVN